MAQPAPPPPQTAATPITFSQHCEAKMWQLMKDSSTQVGSHYEGDRDGKSPTDCITYVRQVLEYGFEQMGQPDKVEGVRRSYEKGTDLARYLVSIGWNAYYWNPDVRNPRDRGTTSGPEHPAAYLQALRNGVYYNVAVNDKMIINYNRTQPSSSPNDMDAFMKFSKVKFSYGLARGGYHTFLLSYGMVFEVHWRAAGAGLYERSSFYSYSFLDGIVLVPPDSDFSL